jgi:hypothetical protein
MPYVHLEYVVDPSKFSESFLGLHEYLDEKRLVLIEDICNAEKSLRESIEALVGP